MNHTLRLSPCPNDTFAFYALLHGEIDTEGESFSASYHDIETLNEMILSASGDIIKGSIAVLRKAESCGFTLLDSGSALGRGNGPVVVRKSIQGESDAQKTAALPGEYTTAALLFRRYFPDYTPSYYVFNTIAEAVEKGETELGVLIHEGRFTFTERGLELVCDLGQKWENETGLPLPLGGIYCKTTIDSDKISRLIRRSIEWAFSHREQTLPFVRSHATELSEEVMQNHIDYFVNEYSLTLGTEGREAINTLCPNI